MEALGHITLYNWLLRERERLPYGENPAESYNLSTFNVPAMFASHRLQQPKAADEFRVLLIGDSGTWGWFLENEDTLAEQLNEMELQDDNGRLLHHVTPRQPPPTSPASPSLKYQG